MKDGRDPGSAGEGDRTPAACLSCNASIVGPYCAVCGQKNDDLRRASYLLARDFIEDTFAFDSRMWRTLGLMATAPGAVPTNYSQGKRSRYTPPVRLFLVVSFLFFLTIGLTRMMFVAFDVEAKTPAEIAADQKEMQAALDAAGPEAREIIETAQAEAAARSAVEIDGQMVDCDIRMNMRFFVRPQDLTFDEEKWRACADSIANAASEGIETDASPQEGDITDQDVKRGIGRVLAGVNAMVADPGAFNQQMNAWLPRIMFLMAPVLALFLAMFIRGPDALLFDHLVLAIYSHAAGFAVIGAAVILAQFGVPYVFPVGMAVLGVYFIAALKRAYQRGWVKTVYSALFVSFLYLLTLTSISGVIIANQIWRAAP